MGEDTRAIEEQIEETRERMGDTVAAISHKADVPGRVRESVADKTHAVTDKLSSAKHAVTGSAERRRVEHTGRLAEGHRDGPGQSDRTRDRRRGGWVRGRLPAPGTRLEDERIGPMATQVREQVSDVASEAVEHGKQVAQDAAEAATDAAKDSGQQHAAELRESAQETIQS